MALDYLRQYAKSAERPTASIEDAGPTEALESLVDGRMISGESGSYFLRESIYAAGWQHGLHSFGDLFSVSAGGLAEISRDPELHYANLANAVFLDTETTGLSLGAGTYVFLVGAGFLENDEFHVLQFLLLSPTEELPFLAALDAFLGRFSVLITFNGKAFDWPLLANRFVGHRQFRRPPLADPVHVDLLHPARRLWKRRLESCALSSLETNVLAVQRTGEDVPGWLIPSIYFAYVRGGGARALQGVFYHNLQDILSLATLTVHIHRVLSDPLGGLVTHGLDLLSLAKNFEREGDNERATSCLEEALHYQLQADDVAECLTRLALIHKREGRWDAALALWDRLIDHGSHFAMSALIERAKFYEHIEHSYLAALDDVQQAFVLVDLTSEVLRGVDLVDLERRRSRLVARAYRERSWVER